MSIFGMRALLGTSDGRLLWSRRLGTFLGREQQIRVVVAEICKRRYRLQSNAFDTTISVEAEGHVSGFDRLVIEARDESVVLPVLETSTHARRRLEIDREPAVAHSHFDVAVPRIGINAGVTRQLQ